MDDSSYLDWVFDQALARIEDGKGVAADEFLGDGRERLRADVESVLDEARAIAVVRPRANRPRLRGYTILSELGRGGMGTVYLARQERLGGRAVALKVLPPSAALSPRSRERFRAEANAVARLRHPNIVAIHDVIEDDGLHAFAMEWVDGRSLAALVDHLAARGGEPGVCDVREFLGAPEGAIEAESHAVFVCRLGISISRALDAVHASGLLHRDVKPSNILLRKDGSALLSDFGLARDAEPGDAALETRSGQFVGTPAYAAPEQLRGERARLGPRTDVYSLGATLYHALALRPAFSGDSTASLLREIEAGRAAPLRRRRPSLSIDLATIVEKAMDPEPERRYATAGELADDLERLLHLEPIRARPAGLATRTAKLVRRHRVALVAAAIASAATLAVAAAFVVSVFFVPKWVEGHVTAARLALLDPERGNDLFVAATERGGPRSRSRSPSPSALRAALESYDAARRLAPGNAEIALEREAVRIALDSVGRRPAPARTDDPRALGLLSYLRGEHADALAAWTQLDAREPPGAFVEAALGILHLARNEPALAYPRLVTAAAAFPDVGFLAVYLADAALRCGDVARAERLVESARGMRDLDPLGAFERVEADLDAALGRDERARARYERLILENDNVLALVHFARFLEARGDFERALEIRIAVASERGLGEPYVTECVAAAERCFGALSVAERSLFLRRALDEPVAPGGGILTRLASAEFPSASRESVALGAPDSSPQPRRTELSVLARALEEVDMSATRIQAYPGWTKRLLVGAWLSEDPVGSSLLVDRLWRRWRLALSIVAAVVSGPVTASAQTSFEGLGHLSGPALTEVNKISADGTTVIGTCWVPGGHEAFRWRRGTGMESLGEFPGGILASAAYALTPDGSTIVGWSASDLAGQPTHEAFVWTEADGMQGLGFLDSSLSSDAFAITDDGSQIFGNSDAPYGVASARWSGGVGPQDLGYPDCRSRVWAASSDGSVLAGTTWCDLNHRSFRWTASSGFELLDGVGDLPGGGINSQPRDISPDGTVIVGSGESAAGNEAFHWTESTGMVGLGDHAGGAFLSGIWRMAPDKSLYVGFGTTAAGLEATIWEADFTIRRAADFLAEKGVSIPPGWFLQWAGGIAVTCETVTIAGYGLNPNGDSEAWVATYPAPAPLALRAGNVDTGDGGDPLDVMFVNGSAGDPVERKVTVTAGVPAALRVAKARLTPNPNKGGYGFWIYDGDLHGCEDIQLKKSSDGSIVTLGQANGCMPVNNIVMPGSCPCPLTFPLGKTAGTMSVPKAALLCLEQPAAPKSPTDFTITFPAGTFTILSVHLDLNAPASPAKNIAIGNTIVVVSE